MPNPEVSVILPFFNAASTLQTAIESIINQTFTSWECILVDNVSTDCSLQIAQKMALSDKRIHLFQENKKGVVHAWAKGLSVAKGKFIARMDADDISMPERFNKQTEFLNKNQNIGVVSCMVKFASQMPNSEGFRLYVEWVNSIKNHNEIELNQFVEMPLVNPTAMFRTELAKKYGTYTEGDYPEDYELWLRWLSKGVRFGKVDETLFVWNDSPTRLTRTDEKYSEEAFARVRMHYLRIWLEKNNHFHPEIAIWGAGKKARKSAALLKSSGILASIFIDVDKKKTQHSDCIHYSEIDTPGKYFIVSLVSNRGVRSKIRKFLAEKGFIEGKDFVIAG